MADAFEPLQDSLKSLRKFVDIAAVDGYVERLVGPPQFANHELNLRSIERGDHAVAPSSQVANESLVTP